MRHVVVARAAAEHEAAGDRRHASRVERVDTEYVARTLDDGGEATVEVNLRESLARDAETLEIVPDRSHRGGVVESRSIRDQPVVVRVHPALGKDHTIACHAEG